MSRHPNILIVMVDQLNGTLFPDGPAEWLHTPYLKRLAARSVRFANTYSASPLCAPGRASFMSGQLPRRTRVYDNAAEFSSDIPTYAHHLRRAGYQTTLSGKMHFVGPDQLHGFEERLTTDIYPADFGCAADPDLLFNLETDPGERRNLAADPAHAATLAAFRKAAAARWDLAAYDAEVRQSQARRWVVHEALRNGSYLPWDFQPLRDASERYMRNHMDLNALEDSKRFPRGA